MTTPETWELDVPASLDAAEALTNFLWELGAMGVVEESNTGDENTLLRAFFPAGAAPDALAASVRDYLDGLCALGVRVSGAPSIRAVSDPGWAEAWREHFRPIDAGRSLLVAPPWAVPAGSARHVVVIEPGRAFGTGHHGSTLGCLEALEDAVERERPMSAIDVGTGSGILAIAAARLGVPRVLAVDADPDAVREAGENARRNGVGERVDARLADATTLEADAAPLVLANLLSAAHRQLGDRYARLVAAHGLLVLGGVLDAEAAAVGDAIGAHGFPVERTRSRDGWTTLECRHAPLRRRA